MDNPFVSVVIVNWNHGDFIEECLKALFTQQGCSFEVIVVDNGSTDGSREWVASHRPNVHLYAFSENQGFSKAFNYGAEQARGTFVLSLNPDVRVMTGFVREMLLAACQRGKIGIVAPKLLRADDPATLDSTGLFIDRRRRPYDRGQGEIDRGQYDALTNAFGACGAAALYRRDMLEDLAPGGEFFDEDFFAYYEDADLAWRARMRGWRCVYAPRAVATHARGWGDTLRKRGHTVKGSSGPRLALRNRYLMTIKNDAWRYTLLDLPWILGAELPRLVYAAVMVPGVLLGLLDLLKVGPSALRKRKRLRARQTVDDATIRRWFVAPEDAAREEM
jgi:GT2 family glycosyltransferase